MAPKQLIGITWPIIETGVTSPFQSQEQLYHYLRVFRVKRKSGILKKNKNKNEK